MKKTYILGLFLALVLLGGCRKTLVVHVPVTPDMSEAKKKVAERHAVQEAKWKKFQQGCKLRLELECPTEEAWQAVDIHSAACDQGSLFGRAYVAVTAINNSPYPVSVRLPGRAGATKYVSNLGRGCRVNLIRRINTFMGDGNFLNLWFEATAFDAEGRVLIDRSAQYGLSAFDTLHRTPQAGSWIIMPAPLDESIHPVQRRW